MVHIYEFEFSEMFTHRLQVVIKRGSEGLCFQIIIQGKIYCPRIYRLHTKEFDI